MQITVEKTGTFDRTVTVRFEADQVNQQLDQELQRLASTVKLPGFRPGKIPRKHLEARFWEHLVATVTENLLRESYPKALKEHALMPADEPEMNLGELKRDAGFVYVANMQIVPEVAPEGYQGLELTRRVAEVTESDLDLALEKVREQHVRFEPVEGVQAKTGDQVVLNFAGFVDGEAFEGGTADDYVLELGSGRFIPGFEDQLVGVGVGEEREVNVSFPEQYGAPHLAGKAARFKCTVTEIRERVLPPLDDDLATLVNIQEGGLAKLREEIRESLEEESQRATERLLQRQIHKLVLAANPMELPEKLVAREQHSMVEYAKREYQSKGMDPEKVGLTDEVMAAGFKEAATKRVTLGMLLGAIAAREQLQVDDARVARRINQIAASYGPQAQNFRKWLQQDKNRMEEIRDTVLEDQVIHWIIQQGVVTEERCTLTELADMSDEK
ncbi:MAG: trigger factor [Magnetococcales bacterium]|nr:trigger factor [Magnetococcales bacterium]